MSKDKNTYIKTTLNPEDGSIPIIDDDCECHEIKAILYYLHRERNTIDNRYYNIQVDRYYANTTLLGNIIR